MEKKLERRLFQLCVDKWGRTPQILMCLEEMNELGVLLCHSLRKKKRVTTKELTEEITDVRLMLDQIEYIFQINPKELAFMRTKKIKQLEALIYG